MRGKLSKAAVGLLLPLTILLTNGCSGSSPTEPEGDFGLAMVASFRHTSLRETMRRVQIRLDGAVIRDFSSNSAFSDVLLSATARADKGQHTLELRVVEQTSSPNTYRIGATVDILGASGTALREIELAEKTVSLSSGQGVSYTFAI